MENDKPKTKLGAALFSLGGRLTTLFTLGGKIVAEPQEGGQLEKRAAATPPANPRAKQQRHKVAKPTGKQARRQRQRQRRRRKRLLFGFLLATLGAGGSIATLYTFAVTRISVGPASSLNPSSPFATPFVLTNDSYLPIYNVDFSCQPHSMQSASSAVDVHFKDVETRGQRPPIPVIGSGERATTDCTMPFGYSGGTTDNADVSIVVRFKPFGIPWESVKRFRYAAVRGSDGNPYWHPKALSEQ